MSDINLNTQYRHAIYRGPTTSDDINNRIEENYKDLVFLANKIGLTSVDFKRAFERVLKDIHSLTKAIEDMQIRLTVLEQDRNLLIFSNEDQIDTDRFNFNQFNIPTASRCNWDFQHNLITLPKVESGSISKLKFINSDGEHVVPSSFEMVATRDITSADNTDATVDTTDTFNAVLERVGKAWVRNVIVDEINALGAILSVYIRFPTDISIVENTNAITVHPFPIVGCDLLEVSYSTEADILLNDSDNYYPCNIEGYWSGEEEAIGWVPPGGWTGDTILNCGPKTFYFDPKPITALKLKLRQRHHFKEGDHYVYSYGISKLDARYDKFLDTGKVILRFDAPPETTISSIDDVTPHIWNVPEAAHQDVFSYRIIWEQGENSGIYNLNPVPFSKRVWIEVTLNKTFNGGTPALSSLEVSFS